MADVTFERSEYKRAVSAWELVDDVAAGEKAIKAKRTAYLPQPNPNDKSPENTARFNQYLARAVFYNATGRTLQGLVGSAFRKWPVLETPDRISYVVEDIDGAGVSIYQQSQSVLRAVMKFGRIGLLVDYPRTEGDQTEREMRERGLRSTVVSIDPRNIVNWRTDRVGAVHRLSLLVIKESAEEESADGFGLEAITQYRVLRLSEGVYTQEVWRKGDDEYWHIFDGPFAVRNGNGRPWSEIPFTFVGSNNNDTSVDPAPLYDMASINVAHYRNSADYEDSVFFAGQAQPWISGLSDSWRDWMVEQGIYVGSRAPILLPENGAFGIAQAEPNTLAKEAMTQKEAQMVALGARLIQPGSAVKTATEAQGDQEVEHSVLSLAVSNVSEAYGQCLDWMAQFMNTQGEIEYTINQDFVEQHLDPQLLTGLIQAWQSGQLPESDLWGQFRKYGVIDPEKTDEAIREELETQDPGLAFDGTV